MNKLTVDLATGQKLAGLQQSVELCDPFGHTLGWFQPAGSQGEYEYFVPPFTEEELRHADEEEGGRSLDEILKDLERRQ